MARKKRSKRTAKKSRKKTTKRRKSTVTSLAKLPLKSLESRLKMTEKAIAKKIRSKMSGPKLNRKHRSAALRARSADERKMLSFLSRSGD